MSSCFEPNFRLGILGGGQLGKMLTQACQTWHIFTSIMDPDVAAPARALCNEFTLGSLQDFDAVLAFARNQDVVTIEIESVDVNALEKVREQGVVVHPSPDALRIIQDKGLQKKFFLEHGLPSAKFGLYEKKASVVGAVEVGKLTLPFVQKACRDGYDGKGVVVVRTEDNLEQLLDVPCLVEDKVEIRSELSVIAARRPSGQIAVFPPVEMIFNEQANLVEMLLCPANISSTLHSQACELAMATMDAFKLCGLLAVEMFLDTNDHLWINEVAPRPHNSGHHTLVSTYTSQYEQHLRAIFDLPLGSTVTKVCSAMVNLLGAEGYEGRPIYEGMNECLEIDGCSIYIYGKQVTRPFRKMGHATLVDQDRTRVLEKAHAVREKLKVIS